MQRPMPVAMPNITINASDYQRVVVTWDQDATASEKQAVLVKYEAIPLNSTINMDWPKMVIWLPNKWTPDHIGSDPAVVSAAKVGA